MRLPWPFRQKPTAPAEEPVDEIERLTAEIITAAQNRPHEFRPWPGAGCELCERPARHPVH